MPINLPKTIAIVASPEVAVVKTTTMEQEITIRPANSNDYDKLINLLASEKLPVEDINPALPHFFVTEENRDITAAAGLELYNNNALLRSVIVNKLKRNQGLGAQLIEALIEYARGRSITKLYLLTTTAAGYFQQRGFIKVGRNEVPESVLQSQEFNGLCPVSAIIMYRSL